MAFTNLKKRSIMPALKDNQEQVRITLRLDPKNATHKKVIDGLQKIAEATGIKGAPTICIELLEEAVEAYFNQE